MPAIARGEKPFEVRLDDRGFNEGDTLLLEGWYSGKKTYSGQVIEARVTFILYGGQFGLEEGYVAMGIRVHNHNLPIR